MLNERLTRAVKTALSICRAEDLIPDVGVPVAVTLTGGAYVTDVAQLLARRTENTSAPGAARAAVYAESLAENINAHTHAPCVAEASPTGLLYLRPTNALYAETVRAAVDTDAAQPPKGVARALVEFVSANPHTPLSLAHAKGAAIGDALCRLLEWSGYTVQSEFYVNDAASAPGLRALARAVFAAYRTHLGLAEPGDTGGEYVAELARKIVDTAGDRYAGLSPEAAATALTPQVSALMQETQRETLSRFGVRFDQWFNEATLLAGGALQSVLDALLASGSAYANGGALWLRTTTFGDDSDRVLLRSDGTPSYFAGDLAYHAGKLQTRAFDLAVDVWNADHAPYVGRTMAGLAALGIADVPSRLRIAVFAPVRPVQDGSPLSAGRYAPGVVSLGELLDAGAEPDALRFALLLSASVPPVASDLDVNALAPTAPNHPLALIRTAIARAPGSVTDGTDFDQRPELCAVIQTLDDFAPVVATAVETVSPAGVARFAQQLADAVNALPADDAPETIATLSAAAAVLRNTLRLLGVGAV